MRPSSLLLYIKKSPNLYVERPVILKDNELDIPKPKPKAATVSALVDAGAKLPSKLSKGL
jgi:hypothetical protein